MNRTKDIERYLQYVHYAINSLAASSLLLLGTLWGYYKLVTTLSAAGIALGIYALSWWGNWALGKISIHLSSEIERRANKTEPLIEGRI